MKETGRRLEKVFSGEFVEKQLTNIDKMPCFLFEHQKLKHMTYIVNLMRADSPSVDLPLWEVGKAVALHVPVVKTKFPETLLG